MNLSRRDALSALLAGGVGIGGSSLAVSESAINRRSDPTDDTLSEDDVQTLVQLTDVIYPSSVEAEPDFVRTYTRRLPEDRRQEIKKAVRRLDVKSRKLHGTAFKEASSEKRDAILRTIGVANAQSNPTGTTPEHIRYHLVNSLLYALFTSPKGSRLAGIENPVGHPGGYESLMRRPDESED